MRELRDTVVGIGVTTASLAALTGCSSSPEPSRSSAAVATGSGSGSLLLPDLRQRRPYGIQVSAAGSRFRLGFESAVENVGRGPLLIVGRRRSRRDSTMVADQIVRGASGSLRQGAVGRLRYVESKDHSHWHYLRFERYELRRATDRRRLRRDRKTGFCLGDRYDAFPSRRLAGEPTRPIWVGRCGLGEPGLLHVREGISVGYGDNYQANLEGQFLDITGLPPGRYLLVHRVNLDRELRESRYSNNAASVRVALTWPQGRSRMPAVRVLVGSQRRTP
jgi:Lysyl oxidase